MFPDLIDRRHEHAGDPLAKWCAIVSQKLGVDGLEIEVERQTAPGGDDGNEAHTHGSDDLRSFTIGFAQDMAFPTTDGRRTVIHELLHVAFRHVASVAKHVESGPAKAWLTQAIEEDTEALAEALERWIDG